MTCLPLLLANEGRANCRIPIFRSEAAPIIIFTDAEGKKRKGNQAPSGHIGFKAGGEGGGTVVAAEMVVEEGRVSLRASSYSL